MAIEFMELATFSEFRKQFVSNNASPSAQLISYKTYIKKWRKSIEADLDKHVEYARQQADKLTVFKKAERELSEDEMVEAFETAKFPPTTDARKRLYKIAAGQSVPTDIEAEELYYRLRTKQH